MGQKVRSANEQVDIGPIRPEEASAVEEMITRVTQKMVQQDFNEEGTQEFFGAVRFLLYERPPDHIALVARIDGKPVGYIHLRSGCHICFFFVDLHVQGQGIGRQLFDAIARVSGGPNSYFEVNSSLFAVPVYEALGFTRQSGVQRVNGIQFVELTLGRKSESL